MDPLYWLLPALPLAVGLRLFHAPPLWVFLISSLAIIPLAGLMGRATENLADTLGAGLGGLLNATFGNAAELIIALVALSRGPHMYPLVKASVTGSIIGNILLVLGLSITAGGVLFKRQTFNRTAASMGATLLALACIGLILPSIHFRLAAGSVAPQEQLRDVETLSEEIALILAVIYLLSLVFSLRTHRNLFTGEEKQPGAHGPGQGPKWGRRTALLVLAAATAGVALMSEFLVGSVEEAAHVLGLNEVFVGVIVVAVIGNAAEHSTAVIVAVKDKMDLAVNIAIGSSIQVALFVTPVLVFATLLMGYEHPLDLHFTVMEVIAVVVSITVLYMVCNDGETHWMEGVMLLAVYIMLALAFYHLPLA
jgi:Ca2+:H+ antiporter